MNRAVRTTVVYGFVSALAVMPATWLLAAPVGWPMAFKLALWADLFCYAVLLARWSGKGLPAIVFPLALILGTAVWPGVNTGFFFLGLGTLGWVRSGICFSGTPVRAVAAEIITLSGGAGLVALLGPGSGITWSMGIWLFFLVQALYFFIVPATGLPDTVRPVQDPFEQAHREALRVLEES
jgi:hypothetical protein